MKILLSYFHILKETEKKKYSQYLVNMRICELRR